MSTHKASASIIVELTIEADARYIGISLVNQNHRIRFQVFVIYVDKNYRKGTTLDQIYLFCKF